MQKCFICGGDVKKILSGRDYMHHSSDKIYNIVKCEKCGVERIFPIPKKEEIMTWYPSDYYSYNAISRKESIEEIIMNFLKKIFSNKSFNIPRKKGKGRCFLDLGCGDGINLGIIKKRGRKVYGFEIGEKQRKGDIFYGPNISDINFGKNRFDIIYLSHVIEHMEDPEGSFKKIHSILKDGGEVIVKMPNIECTSSEKFGAYAVERDIPRHLTGYTKKSATLLFKKCGFIVKKMKYLPQGIIFESYVRKNRDQQKKIRGFMKIYLILYRLYLTIIRDTNQMGFILKK